MVGPGVRGLPERREHALLEGDPHGAREHALQRGLLAAVAVLPQQLPVGGAQGSLRDAHPTLQHQLARTGEVKELFCWLRWGPLLEGSAGAFCRGFVFCFLCESCCTEADEVVVTMLNAVFDA